ncbi:MAG: alpha/beta hydrolase [Desulfobacteraceae bacterium]|nr:alpha/beta hydrolase [Desulfobacteraceae bacterium]
MKNLTSCGDIAYVSGTKHQNTGDPSLIFVHGAGQTHDFWNRQIDTIGDRYHCMALSLPGHGESGGKGRNLISGYAADILDFLDRLEITAPVICGLSMGGAIVQHLLINHANTIKAGILVNTGARLKVLPAIFEVISNDFDHFIDMVYAQGVSPQHQSETMFKRVRAFTDCTPQVTSDDFIACNEFDTMNQLHRITAPVLVLGAEDDKLTPVKYAHFLVDSIRGAKLEIIRKAGHFSPVERPETVNRAIIKFVGGLTHSHTEKL